MNHGSRVVGCSGGVLRDKQTDPPSFNTVRDADVVVAVEYRNTLRRRRSGAKPRRFHPSRLSAKKLPPFAGGFPETGGNPRLALFVLGMRRRSFCALVVPYRNYPLNFMCHDRRGCWRGGLAYNGISRNERGK